MCTVTEYWRRLCLESLRYVTVPIYINKENCASWTACSCSPIILRKFSALSGFWTCCIIILSNYYPSLIILLEYFTLYTYNNYRWGFSTLVRYMNIVTCVCPFICGPIYTLVLLDSVSHTNVVPIVHCISKQHLQMPTLTTTSDNYLKRQKYCNLNKFWATYF